MVASESLAIIDWPGRYVLALASMSACRIFRLWDENWVHCESECDFSLRQPSLVYIPSIFPYQHNTHVGGDAMHRPSSRPDTTARLLVGVDCAFECLECSSSVISVTKA
jgi:hypothetical protein